MKTDAMTRLRVAESILDLVGETPMLHLRKLSPKGGAVVYAKLKYLNPGGSVKDRAAIGINERADKAGKLSAGSTSVEATAARTGNGNRLMDWQTGYRLVS